MPDPIAVSHPARGSDLDLIIGRAQLEAKMRVLEGEYRSLSADMAKMFDAFARNETVSLTYPDGSVIHVARRRKPNGEQE